jgi:hypothetical protein
MLSAMHYATDPLVPAPEEALKTVWAGMQRMQRAKHGSATYAPDASGQMVAEESVETFRQDTEHGETASAFLVRVWARYKLDAGHIISLSIHDGRFTARITTREASDARIAELSDQITKLGLQLGALSAYLEQVARFGAESRQIGGFEIGGTEFGDDVPPMAR